ncbi:GNAT family N-acetyltransferase [Shouchella hunanensis]|uniref:GNAT family N-acetyltransferase n=1 Tax=Shouchella hunanensis TaxID=766894 RepID=A0ABY7W764_9BACI|nr:GNAT family N-acetyltransferase [Shouchella hunanensis]WDF04792.1 GNAT family N-acetyltransferase [Shouchella hunanensis]
MIRLATSADIPHLIKMRWDFTIEHDDSKSNESFQLFQQECDAFLVAALEEDCWFIWVFEEDGELVSHIYTELVHKVPRPGRVTYPFVFMTNVYTIPKARGKGVGTRLLKKVNEWVEINKYEFAIVWPSDESISYYKRNGYHTCTEPLAFIPE